MVFYSDFALYLCEVIDSFLFIANCPECWKGEGQEAILGRETLPSLAHDSCGICVVSRRDTTIGHLF